MRISDWSSDVCSSDLLVGRLGEVGQKLVERAEARGRIAPEQAGERREMMALERLDLPGRKASLRQADGAEAAVLLMPPGEPRDLSTFRTPQAATGAVADFTSARSGPLLGVVLNPNANAGGGQR